MYTPDEFILKKYADVLIKFALWNGEGIRTGDVVLLNLPESSKAFLIPLQQSVLEAGGNPIINYQAEDISRAFFDNATDEQIAFSPKEYLLSRVAAIDHSVSIISTNNKFELKGVPSEKIMKAQRSMKYYMDARQGKEHAGKLTWTLALFGTEAMAAEANMDLKEYWNQIIQACYLDKPDPVAEWKQVFTQINTIQQSLNKLEVESLHIEGSDIDLHVRVGKNRKWLGGNGRNIPSFELFITPDWRGAEGRVSFNQPLYRYGNLIKDVHLEFKDGIITHATASENQQLLLDMISVEGANKIGEFSLTDRRLSRITKFMAETLFDENIGGPFGNTHIAVGMGYKDSYTGDASSLTEKQWEEMGFNDSAIHTDIVSTTDRTVTATLSDGGKKVIYKNGEFTV
ncbi:aminopeptidase [soil metagenome]